MSYHCRLESYFKNVLRIRITLINLVEVGLGVRLRARMESRERTAANNSILYSFGSSPSFILILEKTEGVNRPRDDVYFVTCIPILTINLILNSLAVIVIWQKEHTGLNRLIIYDCVVNMFTMFLSVVHQSPWFIGWPPWVCLTYSQACKMENKLWRLVGFTLFMSKKLHAIFF